MPIVIPDLPFKSFEKISRANKSFGCVITEKVDGSNSQVVIENGKIVGVGSRNRWIAPGKATDNFGFAGWVERNEEEILKLGDGTHFGEWFGAGIQRTYGLTGDDKRWALFNTGRWSDATVRPACAECVPVLYTGEFSRDVVERVMAELAEGGSRMVPGFMKPEGIIIYLPGPRMLLKDTYEYRNGKWQAANDTAAPAIAA